MAELPKPTSHTVSAIYAALERQRGNDERGYLGASVIGGTECDRALWYGFRWASPPEELPGRKLRIFATGKREEEAMIMELEAAGIVVDSHDPRGRQYAISMVDGHVRGHLDGFATKVPEAPIAKHVLEIKTHNAKSFKELVKKGVREAKPAHYVQMMLYMHGTGTERALYLAANKDDGDLYAERVAYDAAEALRIVVRAERIVNAPRSPAKLHDDPTAKAAFACGWCRHREQCHGGEFARRNCRTCLHSTPVAGGAWRCEKHGDDLSLLDQRTGCSDHLFVPDLVPGEQIDADEAAGIVVYKLASGAEFRDGAAT